MCDVEATVLLIRRPIRRRTRRAIWRFTFICTRRGRQTCRIRGWNDGLFCSALDATRESARFFAPWRPRRWLWLNLTTSFAGFTFSLALFHFLPGFPERCRLFAPQRPVPGRLSTDAGATVAECHVSDRFSTAQVVKVPVEAEKVS